MIQQILLMDADISFAIELRNALEETGRYRVRPVTRFDPALTALQTQLYDLAIIDTYLNFVSLEEMVKTCHQIQPQLPIIISINSREDEEKNHLGALNIQGRIQKPYVARLLIPLIEDLLGNPRQSSAAPDLAQQLEAQDRQQQLEPLVEASRRSAGTLLSDPPPSMEGATVGQVLDQALKPEVSQSIYASSDPVPLPDDEPTLKLENRPPLSLEAEAAAEAQPIQGVLNELDSLDQLDDVLNHIRAYASQHIPAKSVLPPRPAPVALDLLTHIVPPDLATTGKIEPLRPDEATRRTTIPLPPRLPDQEYLDHLPETITLESLAAETNVSLEEDQGLQAVSVEDVTQELLSVAAEEMSSEMAQAEGLAPIPTPALAHYAAHLTQFALENAALGVMILQDGAPLAKAGQLEEAHWEQVLHMVLDKGLPEANAKVKVLYRQLPIGEVLLYSLLSIGDLCLTVIVAGDTPLKTIRRQAAQLTESLLKTPAPAIPPQEAPQAPAESPSPPALSPAPAAQEAPATQPARPAGSYRPYACCWLVENPKDAINPVAARLIEQWLREICAGQDWDVQAIAIQSEWVYIALMAPSQTAAHQIAEALMTGTAERALALDPAGTHQSPWSHGYLVQTPPDSLTEAQIQNFIQFYRQNKANPV
jgi:DNA-binding NarL/FixJ family response regulator